jgi:cystathionine beta-lyase/cystathionine gamma-synthase
MRIETKLIHAGDLKPRPAGAIALPIYQSSTFEYTGATDYHDVRYIRLNNTPNHQVLHDRLAALESGEAGLVAGSGMAAISSTLLGLLQAGDHVLAHRCLYGGSHDLFTKDLPALGITCTFVDGNRPDSWQAALTTKTRVFYVETLTNPLLEVLALPEVAAFAKKHGIVTVIDNTLATPVNMRPIEHGFDLVVHSATKYLNGHSDIVAGAVIGSKALVEKVKRKLDHFGGTLDPHACFLLYRGLKTLAVRVRYQNQSALELARFLASHAAVKRVNHPGLEDHPHHQRARSLFTGLGGTFSFELASDARVAPLFEKLTLAISAPSLGGPETLITRPATTSHAGLGAEERKRQGISENLIRVSIGLESTEDLKEDFLRALS